MTETRTLALAVDRTRAYTRYYLKHLHGTDPHRVFELNGAKLNSAHWIVAHLTVTQNWLLLRSTDGPFEKFSWAKHFTIGAAGLPPDQCPPYAEVWATFKAVHTKVMEHLPTLTDEDLERPNTTGMPLIGDTMRDVITHAIRHEGSHIGHLSWLCKLYGIRTM